MGEAMGESVGEADCICCFYLWPWRLFDDVCRCLTTFDNVCVDNVCPVASIQPLAYVFALAAIVVLIFK